MAVLVVALDLMMMELVQVRVVQEIHHRLHLCRGTTGQQAFQVVQAAVAVEQVEPLQRQLRALEHQIQFQAHQLLMQQAVPVAA
jgi:hypothetical protein